MNVLVGQDHECDDSPRFGYFCCRSGGRGFRVWCGVAEMCINRAHICRVYAVRLRAGRAFDDALARVISPSALWNWFPQLR